jgi:hypothetical protein
MARDLACRLLETNPKLPVYGNRQLSTALQDYKMAIDQLGSDCGRALAP